MKFKKVLVAGVVGLLISTGVAPAAQAANPSTGRRATPAASSLCDLFRWLPWCP